MIRLRKREYLRSCIVCLLSTLIGVMFIGVPAFSSLTQNVVIESDGVILGSSEVYATSGSAADIQTAVNAVNYVGGGTVHVPAGIFHWNGETVTIPAGVNVMGASPAGCMGHENDWEPYVASTIIHNDAPQPLSKDMFVLDGTGGNNKPSRISGLQIEVGDPTSSDYQSSGGCAIEVREAKNFRIDHCTVLNFESVQIRVQTGETAWPNEGGHSAYGLIDHCLIDVPYKDNGENWSWGSGITARGNMQPNLDNWNPQTASYYAGKYQNFPDVALIYVEDSILRRCRHEIDQSNGGMIVVRYCLFDHMADETNYAGGNSLWSAGEVCSHPYWADGSYSGLMLEAYKNTFINTNMHRDCPIHPDQPHSMLAIVQRGGYGFYFGNSYYQPEKAPNFQSIFIWLREESQDPAGEIGIIEQSYIWNNTATNASSEFTASGNSNHTPTENVDYFLRAPNQSQDGWTYTTYPYPHPLVSVGE